MILFFKQLEVQPRSCTNRARSTPITWLSHVKNTAYQTLAAP